MKSCVYILVTASGKYYIGSTSNLPQRLKHHKSRSTPSTRRMGQVRLVFQQYYQSLKDARFMEAKLKKMKRRDYIEKIINDGYIRTASST